jgi:hypothetical protein
MARFFVRCSVADYTRSRQVYDDFDQERPGHRCRHAHAAGVQGQPSSSCAPRPCSTPARESRSPRLRRTIQWLQAPMTE